MSRMATIAGSALALMVMAFGAQTTAQTAQTTGGAAGQSQTANRDKAQMDKSQMGDRDKDFIKDVAEGSQIEIETSKLAMNKAMNGEVKAYATRLVNEHTASSAELNSLLKSKSVTWSVDDDTYKAKRHESLQNMSGTAFDKEYLEDMISDHEKTIARFAEQTQNGKDAQIKAFADKTLPTLQDHLKQARALREKLFKG
jgi:putative membrane protein